MLCEVPAIATNLGGVRDESLPSLAFFLVVAFQQFVFVGPAAGASYVLFSTRARSQGTSLSNRNWLAL
jgi:hypothetical protein